VAFAAAGPTSTNSMAIRASTNTLRRSSLFILVASFSSLSSERLTE
jgi:hypothetical protein